MDKLINTVIKLAQKAEKKQEFPVAAIIYNEKGKIVSCGYNKRNRSKKTTDHAEIIAIEKANKKMHTWRLNKYSMLVTLEPCEMCKTVIKESRLKNVYFLVKRYNYKNQFQKTNISYIQIQNKNVDNYKLSINKFFSNKR